MLDTCSAGSAAELISATFKFFAASQCLLGEHWPQAANVQNGSRFDVIIVGAGTAGSTLTARLAQLDNFRVLLLEAGEYPPLESIVPGFRHTLKGSPYDWNFTTVNDGISSQGLAHGRQIQPRGKVLGGTGSTNDMVYSRGRPEDYYEWADIAGDVWNWTNVLDYFKKTERMTDERIINDSELMQFHGIDGAIEVSGRAELDQDSNKFLEAFKELGIKIVNDMTNPHITGAGRFSHTIGNGRRSSSLTGLLNNIHTDNIFVLTDTFVTKILIENQTAVGVRALMNGVEVEFYANKEVILTAGTFNTPKLLMLSGIGPKNHLQEQGIDVLQDLPVGNNLHDHVMVLNYLVVNNRTCPANESFYYFQMIKYLYDFSGTFSYSDSVGAYLPNDKNDKNIPDFAIYPICMPQSSMNMDQCIGILGYDTDVCQIIVAANQEHELITLPVVHLKPQSRGKVRLNSSDPLDAPLIYSGTFGNLGDFDGFADAIKLALSLVNTTYFKAQEARVLDFAWDKCKAEIGDDRILCMIRDYAMPAWHAVGTAAIGTVVEPDLRVKGINGLRVVDASVMPVIVRGNTNAPVVMIAEVAADFIKKTYV